MCTMQSIYQTFSSAVEHHLPILTKDNLHFLLKNAGCSTLVEQVDGRDYIGWWGVVVGWGIEHLATNAKGGQKTCSKFWIILVFCEVKFWNPELFLEHMFKQVFSPWNFRFKFYAPTEGPLHLRSSNAARHHSCLRLPALSQTRQPSLKRAGAGAHPTSQGWKQKLKEALACRAGAHPTLLQAKSKEGSIRPSLTRTNWGCISQVTPYDDATWKVKGLPQSFSC